MCTKQKFRYFINEIRLHRIMGLCSIFTYVHIIIVLEKVKEEAIDLLDFMIN